MLTIGDTFPEFNLKGVVSNDMENGFASFHQRSFPNKWIVLFSWPKDFTFVCPTEIAEFSKLNKEFEERDAQILGMSIDSEYVHHAWRQHHKDLKDLPFPMLSDIKRELSSALGILDKKEGVAERATFIIDPEGDLVQYI